MYQVVPTTGTRDRWVKSLYKRSAMQNKAIGCKQSGNLDLYAGDEGERFAVYSGDVQTVFIARKGHSDQKRHLNRKEKVKQ